MGNEAPERQKYCFFIAPIGDAESLARVRSDILLEFVVRPVCASLGYIVQRADEIAEPGMITQKIIKRLVEADLVVADLAEHNPNVFYELAVRHMVARPVVQLIDKQTRI